MEPESEIIRRKEIIDWLGIHVDEFNQMSKCGAIIGVKPHKTASLCYLKSYVKSKFIDRSDKIDLSELNMREPRGIYMRKSQVIDWLQMPDRMFITLIHTGSIQRKYLKDSGRALYSKREIRDKFIKPFIDGY